MALPPFEAGAREADRCLGVAGRCGYVCRRARRRGRSYLVGGADAGPVPTALVAVTVNV